MLNENIRALRKNKGASQEEMAESLSVVRQTISKWEKGLSVPDAEMLVRIADYFEVSVSELLGETIRTQTGSDELKQLSERLEHINSQLVRRNESARRAWHLVFAVLGIAVAAVLLYSFLPLMHRAVVKMSMDANEAVIGGADAPTFVYVSSEYNIPMIVIFVLLMLAAAVGFMRTRKK